MRWTTQSISVLIFCAFIPIPFIAALFNVTPSIRIPFSLSAFAESARAQSEMVVVTERTKEYHRPSCAQVRSGKGVIAMTRGQAQSRGFKAHAACDPANPASDAAQSGSEGSQDERQPPVYVYTAPGDSRYHRETCEKLPKETRKKVLLEEAGKKQWPCSVCRPPIRKRTPAIPRR